MPSSAPGAGAPRDLSPALSRERHRICLHCLKCSPGLFQLQETKTQHELESLKKKIIVGVLGGQWVADFSD